MKKLRYINLGHIGNRASITLLYAPKIVTKKQPTLFMFRGIDTELGYFGKGSIDKFFNPKEVIKSKVNLIRFNIGKTEGPGALLNSSTVFYNLMYPAKEKWLRKGCHAIIVSILRKRGLVIETRGANDIYAKVGNKMKKFHGDFNIVTGAWQVTAGFTCFDFDVDLARKIYKLDTEKFTKKGNVKDIGNIICGLHDIDKNLNPKTYQNQFVKRIAKELELEIEKSQLTPLENKRLKTLTDKLEIK